MTGALVTWLNKTLFDRAIALARAYAASRQNRPVWATATLAELRAALGGALPEAPVDPIAVVDDLARAAEPGLVTTTGPRYFGFVTGGALPPTVATEWLTAVWDQPAALYVMSPAAAVVEEVAAAWLVELLGLAPSCSVGFVTGCHMANFTALAAARHELLRRAGWDVEADGLQGAPRLHVVVGDEVHVSVIGALRLLGIGSRADRARCGRRAGTDAAGRTGRETRGRGRPGDRLRPGRQRQQRRFRPARRNRRRCGRAMAHGCTSTARSASGRAQAPRCNITSAASIARTRALPMPTNGSTCRTIPAWSSSRIRRHIRRRRASVRRTVPSPDEPREPMDWVPESSRRARGFAVYAALRSLGRSGVADLVERCCRLARRFADRLRAEPSIRILNDVVLNQVLVRIVPPAGDADAATNAALQLVQDEQVCWLGGSRWHGMDAMRISVSNWSTTEEDIDRSAESIIRAARRQGTA